MPYQIDNLIKKKQFCSSAKKQVFLGFAGHMNKEGRNAYASVSTIAEEIGVSRSTVNKWLRALKDEGLLVEAGQHPCNGGHTKIYDLDFDMLRALPDVKAKAQVRLPAGQGVSAHRTSPVRGTDTNNPTNNP